MDRSRIVLSGTPFSSIRWEEVLDLAAETGYSALEGVPGIEEAFAESTEKGNRALQQRSLRWIGRALRGDWSNPEAQHDLFRIHKETASDIHRMGGDTLFIHPGTRERFVDIKQDFREMAHVLNELGKHCDDLGVSACICTRHDQRIAHMEDIDRLMNLLDLGVISLCPDMAQLTLAEVDPHEVLCTYGEGIRHVFWSDLVHPDNDEDTRAFCEPGQGRIDLARIAKTMDDVAIAGWVVVQWNESAGHPQDSAYEVMEHILDVLKRYPEVTDEPDTNRGLALW